MCALYRKGEEEMNQKDEMFLREAIGKLGEKAAVAAENAVKETLAPLCKEDPEMAREVERLAQCANGFISGMLKQFGVDQGKSQKT